MDKRYMALGTSMLVLKLLNYQSMYGYQIIRELEQQSRDVFKLQGRYSLSNPAHFRTTGSRNQLPANGGQRPSAQILRNNHSRSDITEREIKRVGGLSGRHQPGNGGVQFE